METEAAEHAGDPWPTDRRGRGTSMEHRRSSRGSGLVAFLAPTTITPSPRPDLGLLQIEAEPSLAVAPLSLLPVAPSSRPPGREARAAGRHIGWLRQAAALPETGAEEQRRRRGGGRMEREGEREGEKEYDMWGPRVLVGME
jgi:hypothetical protein